MPDPTNPDHYKRLDPEPIVVIERWGLGFCLGNAVKYISRAGNKPGADALEDLAKARWYVDRALVQQRAGGVVPNVIGDVAAELLVELEIERLEAQRWKVIARALADRVRELNSASPNAIDHA